MSWQDRLQNVKFSITCGDGKVYYPLWIRGKKTKEYNTAIYDFINVDGSFVDRKKPKSSQIPLVFYFQGENHIEEVNDFESSADDPRPWRINHPFYGVLYGQPLNLDRDDSNYNVSRITVEFWETLANDFPNSEISINDKVTAKKVSVLSASQINFSANAEPQASDILTIKESVAQTRNSFSNLLDESNRVEYENLFASALKSADELVSNSENTIRDSQELLNLPSTFSRPILDKLSAFENAYEQLKSVLQNKTGKLFFESQGAAAIANAAEMSLNPLATDYMTREEVKTVSDKILDIYNDYLETIDNNQISIYDVENNYTPNAETQRTLYETITETIGNLFVLAFDSKQERITYTKKDTNIFLLAHQYFGPSQNDENLERFRAINNIRNEELFQIKKGRRIKYLIG